MSVFLTRWRVSLTLILGLAAALLVLLLALTWPTVSQELVKWTGEEEPLAQLKGVVNLIEIRLTERRPALEPDRPMPHTSRRPYAVSVFLEQEADPANVARSLDMVKAAGIDLVRQQFPWEDIEIHAKGDFQDRRHEPYRSAWDKYDRIVQMAEERGMQIIARLDAPPDWSRADPQEHEWFGPPDNYADYGDFVHAVVSRYKGRIRYVQIWNEPNIFPEWGGHAPDPEAYTRLLALAARRAREADPNIVLISAPLAPTLDKNERTLYDLDYLERMLQAGAAEHFDILGMIAYGLGSGPGDHRAVWHRTNFARPQLLRDVLVRSGYGDKPAWIMEMGWSAVPEGMPAPFGRVTEAQQARYTVEAYRRVERDYPWVGVAVLWYFRRPSEEWFQRPEGYFRLVNPDWTVQPVYTALAAEAAQPPRLPSGFQHVAHPAYAWQGPWQVVTTPSALLGTWMQGTAGAEVSFTVDGAEAALVTRRGPSGGKLEVRIEGRAAQVVDLRVAVEERVEIDLGSGPVQLRVVDGEAVVEGVRVTPQQPFWAEW